MSNIAKLFTAYINATGETNAKVISDTLGVPLRTVYRWMESAKNGKVSARNGSAKNGKVSAKNGKSAKTGTPEMAKFTSRAHASITTHANNESSSKILSCCSGGEIEGLNGHTQHFIDLVFEFGSKGEGLGHSHTKDEIRKLLISEIVSHTPEKVKQGIADVQRKKPPRPIEALGRYIANAKPDAAPPKAKPHWQRTDDENNAATLAAMKREMELAQ